jgi:hypothetical protein
MLKSFRQRRGLAPKRGGPPTPTRPLGEAFGELRRGQARSGPEETLKAESLRARGWPAQLPEIMITIKITITKKTPGEVGSFSSRWYLLRRGEEWTGLPRPWRGLPRLRSGKQDRLRSRSIPGNDANPKSECAAGELRAAKRARKRRDAAGEGTSCLKPVRGLFDWMPQGLCPRHGTPAHPKGFPARFLSPGCLSCNPVYSEKVLSSYSR